MAFITNAIRKILGKKPVKKTKEPKMVFASEEEYYQHLFTKDPKWSGKEPNREEIPRLEMIENLISEVEKFWDRNNINKPKIIDFGCGRGWLTNKLARYGEVLGIEPVKPVVEHAKKLFPRLNLKAGSLELLEGQSPHLIVSSEVLEHIPFDSQQSFFDSFYRSLQQDGFCIITTPRAEAYKEWLSYHDSTQPVEDWLTESQVEKLALQAGFETRKKVRMQERPTQSAPPVELYQLWLFQKK